MWQGAQRLRGRGQRGWERRTMRSAVIKPCGAILPLHIYKVQHPHAAPPVGRHEQQWQMCRGMADRDSPSSSDVEGSNSDDEDVIIGEDDDVNLDSSEWGIGAAAGRPDADASLIFLDAATPRLAVVDLDWSRMRAADIFAVLRSFVVGKGALKKVVVYVSNYGAAEMAREKEHGPRGVIHSVCFDHLCALPYAHWCFYLVT